MEEESVWLAQAQMGQLFGKGRTTITEHIQNVFKEGELEENVVCRNFRHTTQHGAMKGKTQEIDVKGYNLDVIISIGYRVKSPQGTQFRIWATQRLKEYIIKGDVKVEVFLNNEKVWLSQKSIAQLFEVNVPAISKHLDSIYETGELSKEATVSILETVQTEGIREVKRNIEYFNLDAIISVGYRVNSTQATWL